MCEPVSIAMGVMAVASQVTSFMGASADAKSQSARAGANADAARASSIDEFDGLLARRNETNEAAAEEGLETELSALERQALARTSAGENGVQGISVDALLGDISRAAGDDLSVQDRNLGFSQAQLGRDGEGIRAAAGNRISSMSTASGPSPFALGLNIAGTALGDYNDYQASLPKPE